MRSSSLFSLVATTDVVVAGLLTRSSQSYCDRLVMTGWGLLFRTLPSTAKISHLDFLYRDILEQIEGSWMFGDTCENYRETRDNSCVIILKSRLNPVGHSARMRSVRDILTDWRQPMGSHVLNDSARPLYYNLMTELCSSQQNCFDFRLFWRTWEQIFFKDWNNFCY